MSHDLLQLVTWFDLTLTFADIFTFAYTRDALYIEEHFVRFSSQYTALDGKYGQKLK